ncbi:unnamed protein product [marine sediment metagenome]|uniref:Uncharacterized protein n=1 Tax=marine sediment metagenome TaxID=412755 RepID=X1P1J4_9ZZZZ
MARRKRNTRQVSSLGVILDFVDVVDKTFERLTGKPIASWLKEFSTAGGRAAEGRAGY